MPTLNYAYEWVPGPGQQFNDDAVTDDQAEGLRDLVRKVVESEDPKRTDDLIHIALTKGKRHARFALEALNAEREGVALALEASARQREARRDDELSRLQKWVIWLSVAAAFAALAQVIVAIVWHGN
jgi:hypothetical protein